MPEGEKADIVDMKPSKALSIQKNMKKTLKGRSVGILVANGTDKDEVKKLKKQIKHEGAHPMLVAPKVGGLHYKDGSNINADARIDGAPSAIFDAVALVLSEDAAEMLCKDAAAVGFVSDAFAHLKAIGSHGAEKLLKRAGVEDDDGVTELSGFIDAAKQRFWKREHKVRTLY